MNVLLFGATGMVGKGVLLECLDDPGVTHVLSVGRSPCGVSHEKLEEMQLADFTQYAPLRGKLSGIDACFFCLGVSSVGMSEADYRRVSFDCPIAAAKALLAESAQASFTFVTGMGTDETERGSVMWARVKGATENALLAMPFRSAFMFRPGIIQPLRGVRAKSGTVAFLYTAFAWLFPVLRAVAPNSFTTTERIGRAMLRVVREGASKQRLDNADINALGV